VDDPVAVALEGRPQTARLLLVRAPARVVGAHRKRRERPFLVRAHASLEGVRDSTGQLWHQASSLLTVTVLLLARHGETDWNAEGRFQGHADVPLNEHGRAQARGLAHRLEGLPIVTIYTSDLSRAVETAELVEAGRGIPIVQLVELREVDVGEWSGLTFAEVAELFPERIASYTEQGLGWRDGETYDAMAARVVACIDRVAREHDGERILHVGHGGTVRALLAHAYGLRYFDYRRLHPSVANCGLHSIAVHAGRFRVLEG
jgi:broad specificity phosphatase PhoE